jgi:hypothetical protein
MVHAESRPAEASIGLLPGRLHLSPNEHLAPARLWRPSAAKTRRVTLNDPATSVMTDFTRESPLTVTEDRPIEEALRDMVISQVHALLVVRGDQVSGLVTAYDIQGDRPLDMLLTRHTQPYEIEVGHIMTPWDRVPKLDWASVSTARVHDIARAFGSTTASHLVVVEDVDHDGRFVRALISRRQLKQQLGLV